MTISSTASKALNSIYVSEKLYIAVKGFSGSAGNSQIALTLLVKLKK